MSGIFKLFIVPFLNMFLHSILVSKVGVWLWGNHVLVESVTDTTAVTEVNIADGYRYKITIEHVIAGQLFASEKAAGLTTAPDNTPPTH